MASTVLSILVVLCCAYASIATNLPRCDPPESPAYGSFKPQKSSYSLGSIVKFSCKDGFSLKGKSSTKCVYNRYKRRAQWLFDSPECISNQCPSLADPKYGDVSLTGRKPGDKATYTCNDGFELVGSAVAKCLRNRKWSRSPPTCRPVKCPKLDNPRYGSVDDGDNRIGTKAVYTCNEGFKLNGESRRKCQGNGKWSGEAPTCEPAVCPKLDAPQYGSVDDGDNSFGTEAVYSCNEGFKLNGEETRTCQGNCEWSGEAPTCEPVFCPKLEDPPYGSVDDDDNSFGTEAVYSCDDGFKLNGEDTRTCQENCEWSGEAPTCEPVICPKLDDPPYGSVDDGDNSFGTEAVYSCDEGFKLNGEETRTCQGNCEWSGEAPTCEPVTCPELKDPENGKVDVSGLTPSSFAKYSCNKGFKLRGDAKRKCQSNGDWTGEDPTCKRIDCGRPPKPKYGYVKFWKTTPGYKAFHGCSRGYHLVGSRVRYCRHDGHWSGKTPSCRRGSNDKSY